MLYQMLGQEKRSDTGGMPKLPAFFYVYACSSSSIFSSRSSGFVRDP